MDKFKNKYRIPPARAQWWNYGWDAAYFLTICTKNHRRRFGKIHDGEMILSDMGTIADTCWQEIPDHAKNIELGVYVVMPNHVHGILILNGNQDLEAYATNTGRDKACLVSGHPADPNEKSIGQMRFQNPGKNTISSILGGYKSAVSGSIRRSGFDFQWQGRFHDHIIRDDAEYQRISEYIINNPANWKDDKFYRA